MVNLAWRKTGDYIPAMPCLPVVKQHREKINPLGWAFMNACVATPVTKKQMREIPEALEAEESEWARLRSRTVWDINSVREWKDVAREAQQMGEEIHMGILFGIQGRR